MNGTEEVPQLRGYRIKGRVQGVFFRVWTREVALEMGLTGTVKNLPDGSVDVVSQGDPETLEAFEERLWGGPPASRVEEVERRQVDEAPSFSTFSILY